MKERTPPPFLFSRLNSLEEYEKKSPYILPINLLDRFQLALFKFYSTERSWEEPNILFPVIEKDLEATKKNLLESLGLLKEHLPEFYGENKNLSNCYVVFNSENLSSGSTFSLAKCIYLKASNNHSKRNVFLGLDRIIHETAHMFLHLLSKDDALILNHPNEGFVSPFRDDPRPMIGIYHAHFVLFRLIVALSNPFLRKYFKDVRTEKALRMYRKSFQETKIILQKQGKFTNLGKDIFSQTLSV